MDVSNGGKDGTTAPVPPLRVFMRLGALYTALGRMEEAKARARRGIELRKHVYNLTHRWGQTPYAKGGGQFASVERKSPFTPKGPKCIQHRPCRIDLTGFSLAIRILWSPPLGGSLFFYLVS